MFDAPTMSVPTLKNRLASKELQLFDIQYLEGLSSEEKKTACIDCPRPVYQFLWCRSGWRLLSSGSKSSKTPVLLPFKPNGKALHIKGFLSRFAREAKSTSDFLSMVADI